MNEVDAEIAEGFADSYRRIERVIRQIPRGRVMTYGSVAADAGLGRAARLVGYALHKIYPFVPWHRVLGKRAKNFAQVAIKDALWGARQREMLEAEGVLFSASAGVDLERYGFHLGTRGGAVRSTTTKTQKKTQARVRNRKKTKSR
jgi:methylated-DNA-protein-cysteine methyltransferase-like protein